MRQARSHQLITQRQVRNLTDNIFSSISVSLTPVRFKEVVRGREENGTIPFLLKR